MKDYNATNQVRTVAQPNYKLANQRKENNATSWKHIENSMPSMNRSTRNGL